MIFPVVVYRCESWSIKKTEHQSNDAFKLCWRKLERTLDCKEIKPINHKGNQLWISTRRTDAEAEAPILWPLDVKSLMLAKIEGKRRRVQQRMRWLDGITNSMDMNLNKLQEIVEDRGNRHAAVHGIYETWFSDWTMTTTEANITTLACDWPLYLVTNQRSFPLRAQIHKGFFHLNFLFFPFFLFFVSSGKFLCQYCLPSVTN